MPRTIELCQIVWAVLLDTSVDEEKTRVKKGSSGVHDIGVDAVLSCSHASSSTRTRNAAAPLSVRPRLFAPNPATFRHNAARRAGCGGAPRRCRRNDEASTGKGLGPRRLRPRRQACVAHFTLHALVQSSTRRQAAIVCQNTAIHPPTTLPRVGAYHTRTAEFEAGDDPELLRSEDEVDIRLMNRRKDAPLELPPGVVPR